MRIIVETLGKARFEFDLDEHTTLGSDLLTAFAVKAAVPAASVSSLSLFFEGRVALVSNIPLSAQLSTYLSSTAAGGGARVPNLADEDEPAAVFRCTTDFESARFADAAYERMILDFAENYPRPPTPRKNRRRSGAASGGNDDDNGSGTGSSASDDGGRRRQKLPPREDLTKTVQVGNWKRMWDASKKKNYYVNVKTRAKTWKKSGTSFATAE